VGARPPRSHVRARRQWVLSFFPIPLSPWRGCGWGGDARFLEQVCVPSPDFFLLCFLNGVFWRVSDGFINDARHVIQPRTRHCCCSFLRATALYAIARICHAHSVCLSVCPFVCPSVTRVYCIKTAERIIEILSPSDRHIILVFRHQGSLCKSEGVTPNGGAKYKGVAIFHQYMAIYRKR